MQNPWNLKPRWLVATLVIGVVLLSTVASHGCDVKGSSPEQPPAAHAPAP
jgi:hypothetical protein